MGIWGPGIYQNDLSDDVRAFYRDQLHRGKTGEEITEILISDYSAEISDVDDCIDFWCALADTQWELGRLTPEVKQKALECIDSPNAALRWKSEGDLKFRKRQEVLTKLRDKLCQPQPAEKKIKQYKLYQCPWQVGDVFALPLEGEAMDRIGLGGQYLLIEKVAQSTWYPGHIIPIVYFKLTRDGQIPSCKEEYNQLEFIRNFAISYQLKALFENIEVSQQYKYEPGEYLCDKNEKAFYYQVGLITTSKRAIPKTLVFVGNYGGVARPRYEVIPDYGPGLPAFFWRDLSAIVAERIVILGTEKAIPDNLCK